jgi:hypothetical protein
MLKNRVAAIPLAALLALSVFGVWYSSVDHPRKKTDNHANQGTERRVPPESPDETIALYTEVLAWFTGLLALVSSAQITFLFRADKTARIAAEAASDGVKVARDEFNTTHRPRLIVRFIEAEALMPMKGPRAQIIVDNVADLTAYVTHAAGDIAQRVDATWIGMPHPPTGSPLAPERVIAPGSRDWFRVESNWPLNEDNIAAVRSGLHQLVLVGHLQYRDANDVVRYTGFYRQFDPADRSYRQADPPSERKYAS